MNQAKVDRAVARITGESLRRIQRMGFSVVPTPRFVQASANCRPVSRQAVPCKAAR